MKIQLLPIKRQWLDMILSGEKKEEYRERSLYWRKRFEPLGKLEKVDAVHFHSYSPKRPIVLVEVKSIRLGYGDPEWGAPTDQEVYILELGQILDTKNIES